MKKEHREKKPSIQSKIDLRKRGQLGRFATKNDEQAAKTGVSEPLYGNRKDRQMTTTLLSMKEAMFLGTLYKQPSAAQANCYEGRILVTRGPNFSQRFAGASSGERRHVFCLSCSRNIFQEGIMSLILSRAGILYS